LGYPPPQSAMFPSSSLESTVRRPPLFAQRVHPLLTRLPFRVLVPYPLDASRHRAPSLGFLPPSRHQRAASTFRGVPSSLRSVLAVSHHLDGFLRHLPCGFVSPHNHVRGSPSGVFPPTQPHHLVDGRGPLAVLTTLPAVDLRRPLQKRRPRLQGISPRRSPSRHERGWLP